MKQFSDYKVGNVVKLCEYEEMEEILSCYPTDEDPVTLLSLAGCTVKICWLPSAAELDSWDGLIAIQVYDANVLSEETVLVPIAVLSDETPNEMLLDVQNEEIDNEADPLAMSMESKRVVRDVGSEHLMIAQLAVETIQNAYRNYGRCKHVRKAKKLSSTERFVHEMASDLIKKVWRRRNQRLSGLSSLSDSGTATPVTQSKFSDKGEKEALFEDEVENRVQSKSQGQATHPGPVVEVLENGHGSIDTANKDLSSGMRLALPPILHIDGISVDNVPNIRWDKQNNDLYVELQAHYDQKDQGGVEPTLQFKCCYVRELSETKWGAGEKGEWSDLQWKIPTELALVTEQLKTVAISAAEAGEHDTSMLSRVTLSRICFNVMHSNLVRKHQLIGSLLLTQVALMEQYSAAHIMAHGTSSAAYEMVRIESNLKMAEKTGRIGKIQVNFNNHEYNVRLLSASELRGLSKSLVVEYISPLKSPVKSVLPPILIPGSGSKSRQQQVRENLLGGDDDGDEIIPTSVVSGRRSPETTSAQLERAEEELLLWEARKLNREKKERAGEGSGSQVRFRGRNNSNVASGVAAGTSSVRTSGVSLKSNASSSLESALAAEPGPEPIFEKLQKPISSLPIARPPATSSSSSSTTSSVRLGKFNSSDVSDTSDARRTLRSKSSKAKLSSTVDSGTPSLSQSQSKKKLKRKKSSTSNIVGMGSTAVASGEVEETPDVAVVSKHVISNDKKQYCIIDKAFDIALQHCSADVQLKYAEVDLLLAQVGIDMAMCNHFQESDPHRGEKVLTIPLHKLPLIQTLSEYIRAASSHANDVADLDALPHILTKAQAGNIIKCLSKLISGPWKTVRSVICQLCNSSCASWNASDIKLSEDSSRNEATVECAGVRTIVSTTQQPARWNKQSVNKFCISTHLATNFFDRCENGQALLQLEACEGDNLSLACVAASEGPLAESQALLRLRWNTYNKTLNLLNDWWSSGVRPTDKAEKEEPQRIVPNVLRSASSGAFTGSSGSGMLRASPVAAPMTDFVDDKLVKISHTEEVLQSLIPFNRAYGFGMNMTQLSSFASYIGGMLGSYGSHKVDQFMNYASKSGSSSGILRKNAYKKCHWIIFEQSAIVRALEELFGQLQSAYPVLHVRLSDAEMACLLPESCLRVPSEQDKLHMGGGESRTYKRTDDLTIGTVVDIAPLNVLKRAYERFDWWDKPDDATLESISGKKGEVVSIAELQTKGRLGIHVVQSDVTDAIPIEALYKPSKQQRHLGPGPDGGSDLVHMASRNMLNCSRNSLRDDNESDNSIMFIDTDSDDDLIPPSCGGIQKPIPVKSQSAPSSRNVSRNSKGIAVADGPGDSYLNPVESIHQLNMSRSAQSWLNEPGEFPASKEDVLFGQLETEAEAAAARATNIKLKTPLTSVNVSLPTPPSDRIEEDSHAAVNAYSWLSRDAVAFKSKVQKPVSEPAGASSPGQRPKSTGAYRSTSANNKFQQAQGDADAPQTAVNFSAPIFDEENADYVDGSSYGRDKASIRADRQNNKNRPKSAGATGRASGATGRATAAAAVAVSPKAKKSSRTKNELQSIINARRNHVEDIVMQSREYNYNHNLKDDEDEDVLSPAGVSYREQKIPLDEAYLLKYNKYLRNQKVKEELVRQTPHSPQVDPKLVVVSNESQQKVGQTWTNFDFPEGPGEDNMVDGAGRQRARARPKSASASSSRNRGVMSKNAVHLSPTSRRLLENRLQRAERADAAARNSSGHSTINDNGKGAHSPNMKMNPNPSVEMAPLDEKERVPQLTVERLMNPSLQLYTDRTDDGHDREYSRDLGHDHVQDEQMYRTTIPSPNKYPNNNYQTQASRMARETAEFIAREKQQQQKSPSRVDPVRLGKMERRSDGDGNSRKEKVLLRELRRVYKADE